MRSFALGAICHAGGTGQPDNPPPATPCDHCILCHATPAGFLMTAAIQPPPPAIAAWANPAPPSRAAIPGTSALPYRSRAPPLIG